MGLNHIDTSVGGSHCPVEAGLGCLWYHISTSTTFIVETAAIIGLVLFLASEILPFTPLKGNGLVDQILKVAREIFPHKSDTDLK